MNVKAKEMNRYTWESFSHPKLQVLRKQYHLENVVSLGSSEYEQQLLLKNWVCRTLPHGKPSKDYLTLSAIDILEDALAGEHFFWCTQFAQVFVQCATALGWYARKVSIDWDHEQDEEDRHHGINDIWSNQYKKWYSVDSQNNVNFEKDGIPLNANEIRNEYLRNKGADLVGVIGNRITLRHYISGTTGFDSPSNYFWFFIKNRNNYFTEPDNYEAKAYLFQDQHNEAKTWFKVDKRTGKSRPHPMYEKQFMVVKDVNVCFPEIG